MKTLAFDIETIGNEKIIPFLPEVTAAKNLKDPEKIQADIQKKKQEQLARMGLDKTQALICCVSILDLETDVMRSIMLDPKTLDEKELLLETWDALHAGSRFLSFNGQMFDVPVLTFRSMVNNVQPSVKISTKRYQIGNHVDVRMLLGNWDTKAKGTLDFYAKILLGESKADGMDGSFVQSMWDCNLQEEIKAYNQAECRSLKAIYEQMVGYYC